MQILHQRDLESGEIHDHSHRTPPTYLLALLFVFLTLALGAAYLPFAIARWHTVLPVDGDDGVVTVGVFEQLLHEVFEENSFGLAFGPVPLAKVSPIGECSALRGQLGAVQYVESGWTKAVFSASLHGRRVAVKVPDFTSTDTKRCVAQAGATVNDTATFSFCYRRSLKKMVKELLLLSFLTHDNVVKLLHFCADSSLNIPMRREVEGGNRVELLEQAPLMVVTEYGSPLEPIRLLQLKWEDRLRAAYNIGRLLVHFSENQPQVSALISDFRASQFVLATDGNLQLTDLDDVNIIEPSCSTDADCQRPLATDEPRIASLQNRSEPVRCVDQVCRGFNERRNLAHAFSQLENLILPHGAPSAIRLPIEQLLADLQSGRVDSASRLLVVLDEIVSSWTSGAYLDQPRPTRLHTYQMVQNATAGADYRCRYVLSDARCALSVFDVHEAASLCNADTQCAGYVMLADRSWSGRPIAVLRTQVQLTAATHAQHSHLFVKL